MANRRIKQENLNEPITAPIQQQLLTSIIKKPMQCTTDSQTCMYYCTILMYMVHEPPYKHGTLSRKVCFNLNP
jgi:hypothetical protein